MPPDTQAGLLERPTANPALAVRDSALRQRAAKPPSHFAIGLGALNIYLRRELLFTRGFAHAGIGWSPTSFDPGFDNRILDPTEPGTFIEGGVADRGGRTDHEIIANFALP
jgi:hypothetical protein